MLTKIKQLEKDALIEIKEAHNSASLKSIWRKYLGRKNGELTKILRGIKDLPENDKPKIGALANKVRNELQEKIDKQKQQLPAYKPLLTSHKPDVTLSERNIELGHLHPLTQVRYEVAEIFSSMGFEVLEGKELETDYYNFTALNIPQGHPARDMWDTYYVKSEIHPVKSCEAGISPRTKLFNRVKNQKSKMLLRTHTSPMQIRVMEKKKPPLKVCVIGKCFRHEATDASHEHTIYQIEGFVVDKEITVANLIYTLKSFLDTLFKKSVKVRLRPSYFPFTEPSFEVDFACLNCQGKARLSDRQTRLPDGQARLPDGQARLPDRQTCLPDRQGCRVCSQTGWVEMLGCGMIHPKVYQYAGYPKGEYTGFAFGIGLDRLAMMKHQIDDIRWFHSGDLRFIKQF